MASEMLTLEDARKKFVTLCKGAKLEQDGVHAVTFQPSPSKANQDRVVSKTWVIAGQKWLFLVICDGEYRLWFNRDVRSS